MIQSQIFVGQRTSANILVLQKRIISYLSGNRHFTSRTSLISEKEKIRDERNVKKTYWQADSDVDIQRVTQNAIIHELTKEQTRTIESVVPWFLNAMPRAYFRQVPYEFRINHIKAISAIKDAKMDLHMNLQSPLPDGSNALTFIRPGKRQGRIIDLVSELPHNDVNYSSYSPLSRVQVFGAKDDSMSLSMFIFGKGHSHAENVEESGAEILKLAQSIQQGKYATSERHPKSSPIFDKENLLNYMSNCSESYLTLSNPRRFLLQRDLFDQVSGSEGVAVYIEESEMDNTYGQYWLDIALANSIPQFALEHSSRLLYLHQFDVIRAHLDVVPDGDNGDVTLLRVLVKPFNDHQANEKTFTILKNDLKRSKWLDPLTMDLVVDRYPWLGVERGEIITAFCSLMHPVMAKQNSFIFSKANIIDTVTKERNIVHAASIADLFLSRFNPSNPLSDHLFEKKAEEVAAFINGNVEDTHAAEMLHKMINIATNTLKTNIFLENRYALGLRLNPKVMAIEGEERELPYGVFFVHGRRFNGFHVRFRDIARGGMRLVTPPSTEQFALESTRHYEECYGLAFAQQMKNKDIPEGGAKAVNLVAVNGMSEKRKNFVVRKSVKSFADALLDLILVNDETKEKVLDFFGKKEVLYLGPDEQVVPEDINWIVKRAAQRGYQTPAAFISSKPRTGINHKEFGVTSEGVNVYLDVALRECLGIDPVSQSFTIKMTGGPDGDVGGNEIKILIREYGENAKIVGIADHSGCAEDPHGLDHKELMRLVESNLCICHFRTEKLGSSGEIHLVDTEEGIKLRNNMHNRVAADAFIPAGGRPGTIDAYNYKQFLADDGTPSSPLIVEAANIFITEEARELLYEEAGVVIVKDSSANKCGVITSSYEICAAMLLSDEEFFENKDMIVEEILTKLREVARMEAKLLFREFADYSGSLPYVSKVLSNTINEMKDSLSDMLNEIDDGELNLLLPIFKDHLPKTIADLSFHRIMERVPKQYVKNAIASSLASRIVYKEGTKFVGEYPKDQLAKIALRYIEKEKEISVLRENLVKAKIPQLEKEALLNIIDAGGARTLLRDT